jgi:hypothetical protein
MSGEQRQLDQVLAENRRQTEILTDLLVAVSAPPRYMTDRDVCHAFQISDRTLRTMVAEVPEDLVEGAYIVIGGPATPYRRWDPRLVSRWLQAVRADRARRRAEEQAALEAKQGDHPSNAPAARPTRPTSSKPATTSTKSASELAREAAARARRAS